MNSLTDCEIFSKNSKFFTFYILTNHSPTFDHESLCPRSNPSCETWYCCPPYLLWSTCVKELKKTDVLQLELKTSPGVSGTATYKKNAQILADGVSCEELILWIKDLEMIIKGLELNKVEDKFNITRRLLKGEMLNAFNTAETELMLSLQEGQVLEEKHFIKCQQALVTNVVTRKALRLQKRYMRWVMCKPHMTKIWDFSARVQQINNYLTYLPPFGKNQSLPVDELLDILEFSITNSWQKEFYRTGFDPMDSDIHTFIERCERIELTEDLEQAIPKNDNGLKTKTKRKFGHKDGISHAKTSAEAQKHEKNKFKNEKFCKLHQQFGHSTEECKVVMGQIDKMRATWEARSPDSKPPAKKSKFSKESKYNKEEIHALVH